VPNPVPVACQHVQVSSVPQVVAHRGASEIEAEHTLAAYRRAIDDGADGLECDVRLTRDGVLVCVHDRRIDRTSSGRGVVSTLELADLDELDFGSWRGDALAEDPLLTANWEAPDWDRRRVLTLERLLEIVADCGRPLDLAIETKHPTRYAGLVELALVELLARFGLTAPGRDGRCRARVMSFATTGLRRVHSMAPEVPTVHLMRRIPLRLRDGERPGAVTALGPALPALRAHPRFVERVHANGGEVHVWTVDDPADVDFVVGLGVDVIITNRPAAVLRRLDRSTDVTRPAAPHVP
jgi:glycerophosphoryl diester phosphodiesterase